MDKKTCVITGATSGIGYAIAKGLSRLNWELVLIGKDTQKGKMVVEKLQKENSKTDVKYYSIDLSSQKQIRQGGDEIRESYSKIDVLINNAAVWTSRFELTEDHIEKQFAVNHLAYFLLTHILYGNIAKSENGKIINMGSDSHQSGKIHFKNINLQN